MIIRALFLFSILAAACTSPTPTHFTNGGDEVPAVIGQPYRWSFDDGAAGSLPADFISVLGDWTIQPADAAPSAPNALRQAGAFKEPDFPRVVVRSLTFTDLTVRVRCRPEGGGLDQACGLMFRLADSDNYYITRANALEGNVRLYRVVNGDRQQFATADVVVASGQWHTLEATAQGDRITVSWNGQPVIDAHDATYAKGKIGLWTKADSVTAFDDLEATAR